jgi:GNAT superfamily N-acetyltransferase
VDERDRRRGIGRALVDAAHARLAELGCRRVSALVGREEAEAGAFWEATGYSEDPKIRRFVRNL